MRKGCKGCARLLRIVNSCEKSQKFCTTEKGVLYLVDNDYYLKNDCNEYCKEFKLEGVNWK